MKNFWQNKKVLVTGGAGFIGSNAVRELVQRGSIVTITVSNSSSNNELKEIFGDLIGSVKIKKVDLLSLNDCLKSTKSIDVVLNFAALDGGAKFKKEHAEEMYRVNTGIVKNILTASEGNRVDRVLIMSSIDVYAKDTKSSLVNEFSKLSTDANGYVGAKIFSEKLAKEYYGKYGLKIAIARPGNVYGPGDTTNPERARVIPTFINKAMKGENIDVSTFQELSFLYVSDLVNALLKLIERYPVADPVNIVGSERVSLENLARQIIRISKSKSKIILGSKGVKEVISRTVSVKKAKKIIGFMDRVSLKEGLSSLIGVSR